MAKTKQIISKVDHVYEWRNIYVEVEDENGIFYTLRNRNFVEKIQEALMDSNLLEHECRDILETHGFGFYRKEMPEGLMFYLNELFQINPSLKELFQEKR